MLSSDDSELNALLEEAKAYQCKQRDGLAQQHGHISLQEDPITQPIASTSKLPAVATTTKDTFGQMPRGKRPSKKQLRALSSKTAGKDWFEMPAAPTNPSAELKREVTALKMSGAIDPKRFMRGEAKKDAGKLPDYFQFGHIIPDKRAASNDTSGPGKAGKRQSFVNSLLADSDVQAYTKKKYRTLQQKSESGGKKAYRAKFKGKLKGIKRK